MKIIKFINTDNLLEIINNNKYINNIKSNKNKNTESLSYLVDIKLSQSDCIKLGFCLEKILLDLILYNTNYVNIKNKNIIHKKETDHLFLDNINKIIYYAELKSNLNLDSEKSKYTCYKCNEIHKELQIEYPNYKIVWNLVSLRYLNKNDLSKNIRNKYNNISNNIIGLNEYLKILKINLIFSNKEYKNFIKLIVNNF